MLIEAMMVVAQIMVLTALLGIMMLVVALAKIVVVVVAARHVVLGPAHLQFKSLQFFLIFIRMFDTW